jgi:hypothetical protein
LKTWRRILSWKSLDLSVGDKLILKKIPSYCDNQDSLYYELPILVKKRQVGTVVSLKADHCYISDEGCGYFEIDFGNENKREEDYDTSWAFLRKDWQDYFEKVA